MIRLVVFDCDGVLVDSEPPVNRVLAENLTAHGLPITAEDTHALFVGGTMQSAMDEARRLGATLSDHWLDEIFGLIFDELRRGVPVFDGVHDLLDDLHRAGVATAIASNGPPAKMQITLGPSGLWDRFQGRIYSAHTHPPAKPAPDMLLCAARDAGVAPEQAIMIDDNPSGLTAARAARMRAVGFAPNGGAARLHMADHVITHMRDIAALIASSRI